MEVPDKWDQITDTFNKWQNIIWSVATILIIVILIFAGIKVVSAKDFGVVGKTWEIKERDAIEEIQSKLALMEKTGQIEEHNEIIKEKVSEKIKSPKALKLERTESPREYVYDPSIVVKEDLKDARGIVFQKKGTRVNPLDTVSMNYELIFFDARDDKQQEFAINRYNNSEIKPRLILTGGSPIEIEEKYKLDVYFDQGGVLIKKLGIAQVPAVVAQEGKVLNIKEVEVE